MKVLYVLRYYPTLTETFIYNEIDEIRRQDPDVDIHIAALGTRADGTLQDRLPQARVLTVPRRPLQGRLQRSTTGQQWLRSHQRPKDVARLPWLTARAREMDHIHVHFAGEAAEWAHALHLDTGIPYTVMVHAVDLFRPRPSLHTVLQSAAQVLTIADHHIAHLHSLGIASHRVRCGPSLDDFSLPPLPETGDLRALFVGRNIPKKGLDTLLEAWKLPPDGAKLEIISDVTGPVPDRVTVLGPQSPAGVRAALQRANLVVLPCREAPDGDLDGVPLVLMEALAACRPVLTCPISGIPELVDETVGWLVPSNDVTALRQALQQATDPMQRIQRGRSGPARLRSRGFTLTQQAEGVRFSWKGNDR